MKEGRLSILSAVVRIALSVVLISGTAWAVWLVYRAYFTLRADDPKYRITAILQTGPEKEALPTQFLAELLGLSADRDHNLYRLDIKKAEQRLLSFPVIAEAHVKRIPPGTLFVDYRVRKPIAFLSDRTNTAFDREMVLFPFSPFYTPKKLPKVYLGLQAESSIAWGSQLNENVKNEIGKILELMKKDPQMQIKTIDLSKAEALSLGEKRILLVVEETTDEGMRRERTLLLNPEDPEEGLARYRAVRKGTGYGAVSSGAVLDLRLAEMGRIY